MALIVQKFGGTSVSHLGPIRRVARRVKAELDTGNEVAVVLSKDGNPEIYLAKANGANLRRLTRNRGVDSAPAWAPDGKTIYFTSDRAGTPHIFAMSRNRDDVRRIT
ncbi:MAG: hypothetical protein QGI52_05020, partial [Alphaproteobacteria bacterium]|nr:hypothetical protein [Alphaproteobacteria bacterium]